MSAPGWVKFGDHYYHVDRDLVTIRPHGVIVLDEMQQMLALYARVRGKHGSLFVLFDSRENTGLDHAARKYATDHAPPEARIDAAASFGASYTMRVFVNMMQRAALALGKQGTLTALFDTEAEAREYLQRERARLSAKQPTA